MQNSVEMNQQHKIHKQTNTWQIHTNKATQYKRLFDKSHLNMCTSRLVICVSNQPHLCECYVKQTMSNRALRTRVSCIKACPIFIPRRANSELWRIICLACECKFDRTGIHDNFALVLSAAEFEDHTIRVEAPITDHLRDSRPILEKYKAVQIFLCRKIERRIAIFFVISSLKLKLLWILNPKVSSNILPMSRVCHNHSF